MTTSLGSSGKRYRTIERVFEDLGRRITEGDIPPGAILRLEDLENSYGISRSVVRDAVNRLMTMGMVSTRRSVGVIVSDEDSWHALHPDLVRWRLGGTDGPAQMAAMVDLRMAVEPLAAGLVARRSPETGDALAAIAERMGEAASQGDLPAFLAGDVEFHRELLRNCGNPMFRYLERTILHVLEARHYRELMPDVPRERAVLLHQLVAVAVREGNAELAESSMRSIVHEVRDFLTDLGK